MSTASRSTRRANDLKIYLDPATGFKFKSPYHSGATLIVESAKMYGSNKLYGIDLSTMKNGDEITLYLDDYMIVFQEVNCYPPLAHSPVINDFETIVGIITIRCINGVRYATRGTVGASRREYVSKPEAPKPEIEITSVNAGAISEMIIACTTHNFVDNIETVANSLLMKINDKPVAGFTGVEFVENEPNKIKLNFDVIPWWTNRISINIYDTAFANNKSHEHSNILTYPPEKENIEAVAPVIYGIENGSTDDNKTIKLKCLNYEFGKQDLFNTHDVVFVKRGSGLNGNMLIASVTVNQENQNELFVKMADDVWLARAFDPQEDCLSVQLNDKAFAIDNYDVKADNSNVATYPPSSLLDLNYPLPLITSISFDETTKKISLTFNKALTIDPLDVHVRIDGETPALPFSVTVAEDQKSMAINLPDTYPGGNYEIYILDVDTEGRHTNVASIDITEAQ